MISNKHNLAVILGVLLTITSTSGVGEKLKNNPFEKPEVISGLGGPGSNYKGSLKLRGTVIDGTNSLVNINGEYYRLNQEVSGYQIIHIENGKVILGRDDNRLVLTINDE